MGIQDRWTCTQGSSNRFRKLCLWYSLCFRWLQYHECVRILEWPLTVYTCLSKCACMYSMYAVAVLPGARGSARRAPSWPASNVFGAHLYWFNCTNKLFYFAAECTIKRPHLQNFLRGSNFQNILSNWGRMQHWASFFRTVSAVPSSKTSLQ